MRWYMIDMTQRDVPSGQTWTRFVDGVFAKSGEEARKIASARHPLRPDSKLGIACPPDEKGITLAKKLHEDRNRALQDAMSWFEVCAK